MKIDTTSGEYDYTFLSLGAGVQSSALLVLGCIEEEPRVPRPDICLFADTGDEPQYVYDYVEQLTAFAAREGVEVQVVQAGVLSDEVRQSVEEAKNDPDRAGWVSVPLYTKDPITHSEGMRRRVCTREYKIAPIRKWVRERLGYSRGQRVKHRVRSMLGITTDEIQRMKPSADKWVTNSYPLVDLGLRRHDCLKIVDDAGLPKPQKSACVYCPYRPGVDWQWLKDEHPADFQKAVDFDEMIRADGMPYQQFVHKSCVPLSEVVFNANDPDQADMFDNECEGMCGV